MEKTVTRLPTPISDHYFSSLTDADSDVLARMDERTLDEEKSRVAPWVAEKLTTATHSVMRRLMVWETLGIRIQENWPPDGAYYVDEYVNDLDTRDALEEVAEEMPAGTKVRFRAVLDRIDDVFRAVTNEDGGASIAWRLNETNIETAGRAWWWHRAPVEAPWSHGSAS